MACVRMLVEAGADLNCAREVSETKHYHME